MSKPKNLNKMDELKNSTGTPEPKNSTGTGLEHLKDKGIPQNDRAKQIVKALGLGGDERSVVVGLKKGDIFQLVAMNKMELTNSQQREGQARFVPITFTTNSGASIGAKHFAGVEIDDSAPAVGSTPLENANFLVWCIDHNVSFKVRNVTSEEVEAHDNVPSYTKKTYKLEVDSYE